MMESVNSQVDDNDPWENSLGGWDIECEWCNKYISGVDVVMRTVLNRPIYRLVPKYDIWKRIWYWLRRRPAPPLEYDHVKNEMTDEVYTGIVDQLISIRYLHRHFERHKKRRDELLIKAYGEDKE
jgi:hypothetical protein